jgi:hypothetical protein
LASRKTACTSPDDVCTALLNAARARTASPCVCASAPTAASTRGASGANASALASAGAVHFQIGKFYHYAERLEPNTLALVRAMKQALDPQRRMNPGVLGL